MRLLLFIAVVLLVLALICLLVPTAIAGQGWPTWTVAGLLFWAIDSLLGGYVFTAPAR